MHAPFIRLRSATCSCGLHQPSKVTDKGGWNLFRVDACVLYSAPLRDLLAQLALTVKGPSKGPSKVAGTFSGFFSGSGQNLILARIVQACD
jgi:hypothetical protein